VIARRGTERALAALLVVAIAALGPFAVTVGSARADVPPELAGRRIAAVVVEGGGGTRGEAAAIGIEPGTRLDRRVVREAVLRLLATNRYVDVQVDALPREDDVMLRFRLAPRIVLARIELRGNSAIDDATLRQRMPVREGSEIESGTLQLLAESARSAYAERGYARAEVTLRLRDTDDPTRKVLLVQVREGEPLHIREVRWDGELPLAPDVRAADDPLSALGLGPGDVLDRRRLVEGVRAVQVRLRESGWLEARVGEPLLQPAEGGVVLVIPLHAGRHYRVVIRGHEPLQRSDVEAVLQLSEQPLAAPILGALRERIVDLYRRHGFHRAQVSVERTRDPDRPDDRRAARLLIAITPGAQLHVIGVSFPGATHFDSGFLRDQVVSYLEEDLPHPALFHPVDSDVVDRIGLSGRTMRAAREVPAYVETVPERIWYEPTYAEAVAHIEELFHAAGFLRARVGPAELRELDGDRAVVTIPVFEGPRTLVWDVRVRGNEVLTSHEILEAARLTRGDPFGYLPLEQARRRVLEAYAERGHLFARVEPIVRFSPDGERAEIVLDLIERFPVTIGDIRIVGAVTTDESLVRNVLALRPGDLYRPSQARASEERLLALGVFTSVQIQPADPDLAERTKPIVVTVSERRRQESGLSGGLSSGEGLRGVFDYAYRNLLGLGITLTVRAALAYQLFFQDFELARAITALSVLDRLERRITLGVAVPWLPGFPNVRAALDLAHIRDNERDFGYDKNGVALSLIWSPERPLTLSISGEIEHNNVQLFFDNRETYRSRIERAIIEGDLRTQRLLRVPEGQSAIGSIRATLSLDLRNNPFTPSRGASGSVTAEYVTTLGSIDPTQPTFFSQFLRIHATLSGYVPIAEGWVFALQGRGGVIAHLQPESRTYPNRAYYLGGVDSLRGFLQDQVIPEDQARLIRESRADADPMNDIGPADIVRTGDAFYLLRAELRFPLAGELYGGVFADVGNVWANVESFDLFVPRWNAGVGLRIATPVGPIALDYGFNLDPRPDLLEPDLGSFHLSFGLF
jgi:outer membrane protein assembly factor BamA